MAISPEWRAWRVRQYKITDNLMRMFDPITRQPANGYRDRVYIEASIMFMEHLLAEPID